MIFIVNLHLISFHKFFFFFLIKSKQHLYIKVEMHDTILNEIQFYSFHCYAKNGKKIEILRNLHHLPAKLRLQYLENKQTDWIFDLYIQIFKPHKKNKIAFNKNAT